MHITLQPSLFNGTFDRRCVCGSETTMSHITPTLPTCHSDDWASHSRCLKDAKVETSQCFYWNSFLDLGAGMCAGMKKKCDDRLIKPHFLEIILQGLKYDICMSSSCSIKLYCPRGKYKNRKTDITGRSDSLTKVQVGENNVQNSNYRSVLAVFPGKMTMTGHNGSKCSLNGHDFGRRTKTR